MIQGLALVQIQPLRHWIWHHLQVRSREWNPIQWERITLKSYTVGLSTVTEGGRGCPTHFSFCQWRRYRLLYSVGLASVTGGDTGCYTQFSFSHWRWWRLLYSVSPLSPKVIETALLSFTSVIGGDRGCSTQFRPCHWRWYRLLYSVRLASATGSDTGCTT